MTRRWQCVKLLLFTVTLIFYYNVFRITYFNVAYIYILYIPIKHVVMFYCNVSERTHITILLQYFIQYVFPRVDILTLPQSCNNIAEMFRNFQYYSVSM